MIEREICIEPLAECHLSKAQYFYSNYWYLRKYIIDKSKAYYDAKTGETKTFVVIDAGSEDVAAYFSLKCSSLRVEEQINDDETEVNVYPTVEVVMFAVHSALLRKNIGTRVLAHIINYVGELRKKIGIRGITLFSVPDAVDFYKKFSFKVLSEDLGMEMYRSTDCEECVPMYLALPELTDEEL